MNLLSILLSAVIAASATAWLAHRFSSPLPPPQPPLPADPEVARLLALNDDDVPAAAMSLAVTRPLEPWARAAAGRAYAHPSLEQVRRLRMWERLCDTPASTITIGWHHGLRLPLHVGSELAHLLYVQGAYDPNEFAFLDGFLRPGMVFVDAGANVGVYTLFAARKVAPGGRVIALEPSARERRAWREAVRLNHVSAELIAAGLGEQDGQAILHVAQMERSGHNTMGAFVWGGVQEMSREDVRMRSLDSLAHELRLERLDVWKLDIEGAETAALRGAGDVMRRFRPALVLELSPASLQAQGSSSEELLELLDGYGYAVHHFDYTTGVLTEGTANPSGENLIALPRA